MKTDSWKICQMVCLMCSPTPVHCVIQWTMCITRGLFIRNPPTIYICCFFFAFSCYLNAHKIGSWQQKASIHIIFKSPCPVSVQHTARRDEDNGKLGVSSCFSLLGSDVCNSSFLTFSRCHGWIWAQNWSAFPDICSGCQRSHCQAGVLCSWEVSKQGHIAQIQEVLYYSSIILITRNNKLEPITALFLRDPLDNTSFVFLSSSNYIIPLPEWEPGISCLQAGC